MSILVGTRKLENLAAVIADPLTPEIVAARVAEGEALRDLCKTWELPYGMFCQWLRDDSQRWNKYESALAAYADSVAQECIGIADAGDPDEVAHNKLRIDTRLRLAAKWDRERYGETVQVAIAHTVDLMSAIQEGLRRAQPVLDGQISEVAPVENT